MGLDPGDVALFIFGRVRFGETWEFGMWRNSVDVACDTFGEIWEKFFDCSEVN